MRTGLLVTLGLASLLLGGTCLPLASDTGRRPATGETLGIALNAPTADRTVPEGDPNHPFNVQIDWSASNLTGQPATVSIILESRSELSPLETSILLNRALSGTGGSGTEPWSTAGYSGPYAIIARLEADGMTREYTAKGLITVQARPTFQFTDPNGDAEFQQGADEPLTIAWIAGGTDATAQIGLDPDTDHTNGDELIIFEPNVPTVAAADSFEWDGKGKDGKAVSARTYNLFASISDNVNIVPDVEGLGQIRVLPAEPNTPKNPQIVSPEENTTFLIADPNNPTLTIEYEVNKSSDVLVDLKLDTDDSHANGNERTILPQQLVKGGTDPNTFAWDGNDPSGPVPPGIYRLFMSISTGEGTPQTIDGSLIYRRADPNQPLIGLLAPATVTKVDLGGNVNIKWRDNDPNGAAKIRLAVSSTSTPGDPNERQILADRPASESGVGDTYAWQVQAADNLTPGTIYYIIAYIRDDGTGLSSDSVAGGRVIVNDPTKP